MRSTCPICRREDWVPRYGRLRDAPTVGVLECLNCGVVVPEVDTVDLVDYAGGSMHGETGTDLGAWRRVCSTDDTRRAEWLIAQEWFKGPLLDFGCGAGGLIAQLTAKSVDAAGVELDRRTRALLNDEGLRVWETVEAIPAELRAGFTTVTLFHVLEHLRDPCAVLRELVTQLPNSTRIVIEVPSASDALLTKLSSDDFAHFTYWSHHEHLHTQVSLRVLLNRIFEEVEVIPVQRYGLANHIGWWREGTPGGQERLWWIDGTAADTAYRRVLCEGGISDTLLAVAHRPV